MNYKVILIAACTLCFTACPQNKTNSKPAITMNTTIITNPVAKAAIDAWQEGNTTKWLALFIDNPKLLDDDNPRDFKKFSTEAIGKEYFTKIDNIEDNGLSVYGQFHSDTWGDFKTYFKFYIDSKGKIYKLEIGQAE